MQRNNRRHRSCRTLWQTRVPPLRPPSEGHLQPRPSIHGHHNEGTLQKPKHQTKHQHRLSPTDRWTIRTNQPMVRTIPLNIWKRSTNRLGQVAATSPIYAQCLAKRDNGQVPLRTNHGTRTICTRRENPFPGACNRFQARPHQSHEASGTASDNACPTDNDQGDQI